MMHDGLPKCRSKINFFLQKKLNQSKLYWRHGGPDEMVLTEVDEPKNTILK